METIYGPMGWKGLMLNMPPKWVMMGQDGPRVKNPLHINTASTSWPLCLHYMFCPHRIIPLSSEVNEGTHMSTKRFSVSTKKVYY